MTTKPRKLTKKEKEIFNDCKGHCKICMLEGGCDIEIKLKRLASTITIRNTLNDMIR